MAGHGNGLSSLIVASPHSTITAFFDMLNSGELGKSLVITLKRQLMGLALGVVAGTLLGVLGGLRTHWTA